MADLRLRPRSASEIVDAAFQVYRRSPLQYMVVTAVGYAPGLVLQFLLVSTTTAAGIPDIDALLRPGGLALFALSWASYSLMSGMTVALASEIYHGREAELGAIVRAVLPRAPALLLASVLKGLLLMLGSFAFFVGAVYVFARFFAVNATIVLERRGVGGAFGRSSALTRERKWHVLGTYLLAFALYMGGSFGIAIVAGITGSQVLRAVLSAAYTIVAYPILGITEALLYYDMRIRGEGYDIEVMAGALDSSTPAAAAAGSE